MFMKKIVVSLFITVILTLAAFALPEQGVFLSKDLGDVQIVYTKREAIATPNHGTIYTAENFGVIDRDGNFIVEPVYGKISPPKEARALFYLDGKYGYFDENWKVVIPPSYRGAEDFSEGLALVSDDSWAYGFIDKDGNTVIPHTLDYAESFKNGVAVIGKVDEGYNMNTFIRKGTMDRECRLITPIKYTWENEYDVQMSANNIRINGSVYGNDELEYPFINYLGYTYMPLSFYTCFHLGFATTWNPVDGLVITPPGSIRKIGGENERFANILGENDMEKGKMFKAQLYRGSVTIAGETYTADDVYYPLLTYRDVVYIPVLWKQGMEGMGLSYTYDLETKSLVFETKE